MALFNVYSRIRIAAALMRELNSEDVFYSGVCIVGMAMNGYIFDEGERAHDDKLLEMVALWLLVPLRSIIGLF